jgi:mRNA interferase MazF
MMSFEQGAIVLIPFPFTDLSSSKQRPGLVLRSDRLEPDLVVCAITSQIGSPLTEMEFLVPTHELSSWGLPKPSKVKLAKLFTLHPSLVRKKIGVVPADTLERVLEQARSLFDLESSGHR